MIAMRVNHCNKVGGRKSKTNESKDEVWGSLQSPEICGELHCVRSISYYKYSFRSIVTKTLLIIAAIKIDLSIV